MPDDRLGLLLLNPVPGAWYRFAQSQIGTSPGLHFFEGSRGL